jgi:AcrR family transcriptional regulator
MADSAASARRRGRPPSEAARRAILAAARELLDEGGLLSVTMEGLAARAGVGKPTIYRHWSNRYEVAMAALIDASQDAETPSASGDPLRALEHQLAAVAALFATHAGRHVAAMLVSGYGETELSKAFRNYFIEARRAEGRALLERAFAGNQLRADADIELALDTIYGPIIYRLTMARASIDAGFVRKLLRQVMTGIGSPAAPDA